MKEIKACGRAFYTLECLLSFEWLFIHWKGKQSIDKRVNSDHKNKQLFFSNANRCMRINIFK